ncbi:MAG TPA: hypothetical protein PLO60_04985, partial [Pseudomonadales bacterium]|nr:hypothetical protein [Pseudomonadales bacterium]
EQSRRTMDFERNEEYRLLSQTVEGFVNEALTGVNELPGCTVACSASRPILPIRTCCWPLRTQRSKCPTPCVRGETRLAIALFEGVSKMHCCGSRAVAAGGHPAETTVLTMTFQ